MPAPRCAAPAFILPMALFQCFYVQLGRLCNEGLDGIRQVGPAPGGWYACTGEYGRGHHLPVHHDVLLKVQAGAAGLVGVQGAGYGKCVVFFEGAEVLDGVLGEHHENTLVGLFFEVKAQYFADEIVAAGFHVEGVVQAIHNALYVYVCRIYGVVFFKVHS